MSVIPGVGRMSWTAFGWACMDIVFGMARRIRQSVTQGAEIHPKASYGGAPDGDVVTDADLAAQEYFLGKLGTVFPVGMGVRCEEMGIRYPCTLSGAQVTMTVDPADGTRALAQAIEEGRLPLPGEVSSMLGVQVDGEALGAYICDVGDLTTLCVAPNGPSNIMLISGGAKYAARNMPRDRWLADTTMLRLDGRELGPMEMRLGLNVFGRVEHRLGSLGLAVGAVARGQYAGLLRSAGGFMTPWDDTPVQAMCSTGEVVALIVEPDRLVEANFGLVEEATPRKFSILYLHRSYLDELRQRVPVVAR